MQNDQLTGDEIKTELDLEFFFERESLAYKLTRGVSGMQINARVCPNPACGNTSYKTYLNADTGAGNCFSCNQKWNKLTFIKASLGVEWAEFFRQAKEILKEQGWRPKRQVAAAVDHGVVKLPYSTPLPTEHGENLVYLDNRGFDATISGYFHLRWCEFGWWEFIDDDGRKQNQNFDNRIVIPVFDLDGTLVTFQGRDLTGASKMKYLFPKGLPGTGHYLLNGQNVRLTHEVAVGEGVFDVMAMKLAFDGEVSLRHVVPVGTFGKHLSYGSATGDDQLGRFIKLKAAGITTVTIMWDGEVKALQAALTAGKLLTGIGLVVRIALLPAGKDPNEILPEQVRKAYYEAQIWTPSLDIKLRLRSPY